jgi:hypothetical protein
MKNGEALLEHWSAPWDRAGEKKPPGNSAPCVRLGEDVGVGFYVD